MNELIIFIGFIVNVIAGVYILTLLDLRYYYMFQEWNWYGKITGYFLWPVIVWMWVWL